MESSRAIGLEFRFFAQMCWQLGLKSLDLGFKIRRFSVAFKVQDFIVYGVIYGLGFRAFQEVAVQGLQVHGYVQLLIWVLVKIMIHFCVP